jgi:hypothetical protein
LNKLLLFVINKSNDEAKFTVASTAAFQFIIF